MVTRTSFEQNQIRTSNPKDDGYVVANADSANDLEEDINYLRSAIKQMKGTPDWKDTPATDLANASTVTAINDLSDATTTTTLGLPAPIHQYKFDETSYGTAADTGRIGDYPLDGEGGTVTSVAGFTGMGSELAADFNNASYLYGSVPYPKRLTGDMTIVALINHQGITDTVISLADSPSVGCIYVGVSTAGAAYFTVYDSSQNSQTATTPDSELSGWSWVFASYTKSTGTVKVRVDNNSSVTAVLSAGAFINAPTTGKLHVGTWAGTPGTNNFDGQMHSVYIYDEVLTEAQMDTIYAGDAQTIEDFHADAIALSNTTVLRNNPEAGKFQPSGLRLTDLEDYIDGAGKDENYTLRWNGSRFTPVLDQPEKYVEFTDQTTAPDAAGSGKGRFYKLSGNPDLFWKPDTESFGKSIITNEIDDLDDVTLAPIISIGQPINQWKFNESSFGTATDSGTNADYDLDGQAGTITTAPGFAGFGEQLAAKMVGSPSYLRGSSAFPLRFTGDFSFSVLFKKTNTQGTIAALVEDTSYRAFTMYSYSNGALGVTVGDQTGTQVVKVATTGTGQIVQNEWHWAHITYDKSTGTVSARVDDNATATATYSADTQLYQHSTAKLTFGTYLETGGSNNIEALFEAAYLWEGKLTEADMDAIYSGGAQSVEDFKKSSALALADRDPILWEASTGTFKHKKLVPTDITGTYAATVTTTDDTPTVLATIPITADTINLITAKVLSKDPSGDGAAYVLHAHAKDKASTTTLQNVAQTYIDEDTAGLDATIDVSGNNARVVVTGIAATSIDWSTTYTIETLA